MTAFSAGITAGVLPQEAASAAAAITAAAIQAALTTVRVNSRAKAATSATTQALAGVVAVTSGTPVVMPAAAVMSAAVTSVAVAVTSVAVAAISEEAAVTSAEGVAAVAATFSVAPSSAPAEHRLHRRCQTIMTRFAVCAWLTLFGGSLGFAAPVSAASGVRDGAHLYNPASIAKAEQIIRAIHEQHSVDVLIETVPGVPADRLTEFKPLVGKAQQDFVTRWAAARAQQLVVDGIYVLICKSPPHTRVVVEDAHAHAFGERDRTKLFKLLASRSWWKSADQGLLGGLDHVRDRLDAHARGESSGGVDWSAILWLIGGMLGLWVIIGVVRSLNGVGRYSCNPGAGTPTEGGALAGVFGGMFGAMAGHWLYESFFGGPPTSENSPAPESSAPASNPKDRDDEFPDTCGDGDPHAVADDVSAADLSNGGDF